MWLMDIIVLNLLELHGVAAWLDYTYFLFIKKLWMQEPRFTYIERSMCVALTVLCLISNKENGMCFRAHCVIH